ncbi:MAG: hypothetical protein K1X79_05815 [Oligoflexia bacterium]|nr:hypothetical protein [Oligoflexia bacterium]
MFSRELQVLYTELSHAEPAELKHLASMGGWRKMTIDAGQDCPASILDMRGIACYVFAYILDCLPPIGDNYRRSRVAQAILDSRSAMW